MDRLTEHLRCLLREVFRMNIKLYEKLAFNNLKKNHKTYVPYLLTCIGTVAMFYMMGAIASNDGLSKMRGSEMLQTILRFGVVIIGIFSFIFLFYTNSFLIKRRKKEIGLYNILGMEKKHIAKMLFFEVLYTAIIGLVGGLFFGLLMSKFMFWLLLKLLSFPVPLTFSVSWNSLICTILLFSGIFLLSLLTDFGKITLSSPIELLRGEKAGEKEPKTKGLIALLGIATLGGGYYIALTTESPLEAVALFFLAVLLVIIGTYCLFTSGSIAVLKLLRKNKKFYYQTKHFTSVSGMLYRMKQNAVGLSNICILSTMVLVMLSGTVSLYIGQEDVLKTRYPKECSIQINAGEDEKEIHELIEQILGKYGLTPTEEESYHYFYSTLWKIDDGSFVSDFSLPGEICSLTILPVSDYNKLYQQDLSLEEDEAVIIASYKTVPDTILLGDYQYRVVKQEQHEEFLEKYMMQDALIFAVNDPEKIQQIVKEMEGEGESDFVSRQMKYRYSFNLDYNKEAILSFEEELKEAISDYADNVSSKRGKYSYLLDLRETHREEYFAMYGGFFFLGIFLGFLFLMATVLIIYYKQISEGFDDKERFDIMQKVGMSKLEIKKSIQSQIRMVFFLPLLVAIVHICFAFPVITKLLYVMNLSNVSLFFGCTVGTVLVFALIYIAVFFITAREYYRIVK